MDLNNLPTLRDKDLEPDVGSINPFREPAETDQKPAGKKDTHYYTATLVFGPKPDNPEPNTRYVGEKKRGGTNRYLINMLRLYASDLGNGANSGGVPLPAVTIYDADGVVTQHFDECDLYNMGGEHIATELKFPQLPIADHRAQEIPAWSTSSNFDAPSDTLANADVQYISTVYSRRFGEIFVIRAQYLTGPDTRAGVPVNTPGYDTRLYSICNYNIWNGGAIQCMLNTDLNIDDEGYYTLVISDLEHRPDNLAQESATWMNWGPYLDGQVSFRHIFRENKRVSEIAAALEGRPVSPEALPYVPKASHCTREEFETGGWRACEPAQSERLGNE
jgi:hypothetical protein